MTSRKTWNGDGKNDFVYGAGHSYGMLWQENGGTQWQLHLIDNSWAQAHPLALADIDRDDGLDIVIGKPYLAHDSDPRAYEPLGLFWYQLADKDQYLKHAIDYNSQAGAGIQTPSRHRGSRRVRPFPF